MFILKNYIYIWRKSGKLLKTTLVHMCVMCVLSGWYVFLLFQKFISPFLSFFFQWCYILSLLYWISLKKRLTKSRIFSNSFFSFPPKYIFVGADRSTLPPPHHHHQRLTPGSCYPPTTHKGDQTIFLPMLIQTLK